MTYYLKVDLATFPPACSVSASFSKEDTLDCFLVFEVQNGLGFVRDGNGQSFIKLATNDLRAALTAAKKHGGVVLDFSTGRFLEDENGKT
jgi:hypothetical protein